MSGLGTSIWANGSSYRNSTLSKSTIHPHSSREINKNRVIETTHEIFLNGGPSNNEQEKSSGRLPGSRWAPRKASNRQEVWTMVTPTSQPAPISHAHRTSTPAHSSPDLGLPYEVQHYILGMMQRIMEEGCYAFASRWIPDVLQNNNWTCSEAVELSTWRNILPENVPKGALASNSKPLEQCLVDAVRIRNSATHRHICSSFELRRMAQQAEDLMSLFSDRTRELKFHKLWTELHDWEKLSAMDMQAARYKMEVALQEIGERPMEDDMDWTPNAISLQEIPADEAETKGAEDYDVHDAMEID